MLAEKRPQVMPVTKALYLCLGAAVAGVFMASESSAFTLAPRTSWTRIINRRVRLEGSSVPLWQQPPISGVPPVSDTVAKFNQEYKKPVVPMYRSYVSDLIANTHLTTVNADFEYSVFFALGMDTLFDVFFSGYPDDEPEQIVEALIKSLNLDPSKIKSDAKLVREWVEGKTEDEIFQSFKSPDESIPSQTLAKIKSNKDFFYDRMFGIGVFTMMKAVGISTITQEDLERWFGEMELNSMMYKEDYSAFSTDIDLLRDMEQLYKEIEIANKKKLASRLEAKAQMITDAAAAEKKAAAEKEAATEEVDGEQNTDGDSTQEEAASAAFI